MAALEVAAFSIFSNHPSSSKRLSCLNLPSSSLRLHVSSPTFNICGRFSLFSPNDFTKKLNFSVLCSAVQEVPVNAEAEVEKTQKQNLKRKLFVSNFPLSFSVTDIRNLFGQCGTVTHVEFIKHKDGKSRGYAFATMASGEEAQAVIDRFDSQEVSGRSIRVEFSRKFKKPSSPPPQNVTRGETRHKIYVSNLAWKVRSTHLKEFFSADFSPVSSRVVFDGPSGKSAGYGFVSFGTKEEAETAISALDGKELLGRPLRLKLSEKNAGESESETEENGEDISGAQAEDP